MKRLIHYILSALIIGIIHPVYAFGSDRLKFGLNANYSFSLNQYFEKPKVGLSPSVGLFCLIPPKNYNFGLFTSINYEKHDYMLRNINSNFYESHYNYDYENIALSVNAVRIINTKYNVFLDLGLFVKFIISSPDLSITYSNKTTGQGVLVNSKNANIITHCNNKVYQGLNIGISKYAKRLCFQMCISEMVRPSMNVTSIVGSNNEKLDFKIFPLELFFGLRYNLT